MKRYRGDLVGLGQFMQNRAPDVQDHTLMALGTLLELIGNEYEEVEEPEENSKLLHAAYQCASAWMLNQGRASDGR